MSHSNDICTSKINKNKKLIWPRRQFYLTFTILAWHNCVEDAIIPYIWLYTCFVALDHRSYSEVRHLTEKCIIHPNQITERYNKTEDWNWLVKRNSISWAYVLNGHIDKMWERWSHCPTSFYFHHQFAELLFQIFNGAQLKKCSFLHPTTTWFKMLYSNFWGNV